MPKNPPHVTASDLTADKLNDLKPSGCSVRRQDPITTGDSEPDPDVVLARGSRRDFETRHPGPSEVALLVEVADSTSGPGATPDYRRATVHRESEGVSLVVNDRELGLIAVRDLLPSVTTD